MMSHFPKNNLTYLLFLLYFAYALSYADAPDMKARFMTAGKASLYDPSYILTRTIDTAAFSPELQLPIQLIYQSNLQDEGGFGYGWRSPNSKAWSHLTRMACFGPHHGANVSTLVSSGKSTNKIAPR